MERQGEEMTEREYPNSWIQTFTGLQFWPLEPRAEDVVLEDIAHALSLICRFSGHCSRFYSVAEHCVLIGRKVGIHGLLHDAAEAYLLDLPRPVKELFPEYRAAENRLLQVIYEALDITYLTIEEHQLVKEVDSRMLATEKYALLKPGLPWILDEPYVDVRIFSWYPRVAKQEWLALFSELMIG